MASMVKQQAIEMYKMSISDENMQHLLNVVHQRVGHCEANLRNSTGLQSYHYWLDEVVNARLLLMVVNAAEKV